MIRKIKFASIPVHDQDRALQFYVSTLGFTVLTDQPDTNTLTPNQITKINIKHMSVNSTLRGSGGYQGLDLQTSVSARDLTFKNDYPLSSP